MKPITAQTAVLAIFGDPVGHSLSPVMHNGWFEDHNLDAVYVALPVVGDAERFFETLKRARFKGANVTVPHKEAAAKGADRSDASVANVLRWEPDGSLSAFNTDGSGFLAALNEAARDWRGRAKRALILGAGGGAQGIAQALSPHVDTIHLANRTSERADAVAKTIPNGRILRWDDLERGFGAADLIINATTLGMVGHPSPPWPVDFCKAGAIVVDIVYRPLETDLLAAARKRGLVAVDGLGMLIHQGARAFELWFGVKPDVDKARVRLLAALNAPT
jgi:shikimate dehydrogenase